MARHDATIDSILEDALQPVIRDLSAAIATMIANTVAARLEAALPVKLARPKRAKTTQKPRRPRQELTRWVADRRARRVPTFVIEATGLETKKQIVARYGEGAAFEKGKDLPRAAEPGKPQEKAVKAKGPVVRKKAAAA
jgi:hypothetical protein